MRLFRDDSEYAARFVDTVSRIDGVVDCRAWPSGPPPGQLAFRIVYYPERIPEGLQARLKNTRGLGL